MKKLKNITLVLGGILIGVALSYSPQIYGAGAKLLGSKVTKTLEVKLNKKSIGQAAVIDGTSYLPVRSLANALNVEVVSVDTKEVNLERPGQPEQQPEELISSPSTPEVPNTGGDTEKSPVDNDKSKKIIVLKQQIEEKKRAIQSAETSLSLKKQQLDDAKKVAESGSTTFQNVVTNLQKEYDSSKSTVDELKAQLATLEAQLAELQK